MLNQAVKRNLDRFPKEFRFQLTESEQDELFTNDTRFESLKGLRSQPVTLKENLRSQIVTSSLGQHGGRRKLPYVFTEQGVAMLSAVLRSETAVRVSVQIMHTFVEMRRLLQSNAQLFARLDTVEKRQLSFETETGKNFEKVFNALEKNDLTPNQGIFYNGQIYDAYTFTSELIRKAKKSLVLIDNYIDDSVLTLFTKRATGVSAVIFTKNISKALALDLKKHNEQYTPIEIREFKDSHDRFLIIDGVETYHIGASLKDLGKKWFAFSKFEKDAMYMLEKLESIN